MKPSASALRASATPWLLAVAAYSALAIILTWPLATHLSSVLPHDLGDPVLNTWILWWNAHAVPLTARWWNAPMFWPAQGASALSEHLVGLTVVSTPIQWMGGSPVSAYNVVFLLSFPLSALAAHALGHTLTGRHDAAAIAGLAFGFNPYRIAQAPHLQVLVAFGMPAAMFALHKYLQRHDRRWLWLFGAAWLQQALSNGYYLLFFPILLALWFAWFVWRADRRASVAIATTFLIASLPLLPFLWKYREVQAALNLERGFGEIADFGADLAGVLDASPLEAVWGRVHVFHRPEGELYPGLTICVLVAIVIVLWLRRLPALTRTPRLSAVLLVSSIACTAIALSALTIGPWSIAASGVKLLSVGVVSKPLSFGLLFFVLAIVVDPRLARAASARSPLMFYIVATMAMYVLSLGPQPTFFGAPFAYRAPYSWLMLAPGFDALRVPARFAMLAILCLSAAAAMAFARLMAPLGRTARRVAAVCVLAAVLADSWITAMPLQPLPARLHTLESLPSGAAVLEIPFGEVGRDTAAMYRSMYHMHPLVNGYSGYAPPAYIVASIGLAAIDQEVLDVMAAATPLIVVADETHGVGRDWSAAIARRAGATLVGVEAGRRIFNVPRTPASSALDAPWPRGAALPVSSVAASGPPAVLATLTDGDATTRWQSATPQRGSEWVILDLGSNRSIDGIVLLTGVFLGEFPRELAIDVSEDAQNWTTAWHGPTAARLVAGATRNTRDAPLAILFAPAVARFVRARQLGTEPRYQWSIADVAVFGR